MRLPRQLDNPQTVPRGLRFDKNLLASQKSSRYILIISPVPSPKTGVLADVLLALLVIPLDLSVKLGRGGQGTPDALILNTKLWTRCRLSGSSDTLAFLRAGPELTTFVSTDG